MLAAGDPGQQVLRPQLHGESGLAVDPDAEDGVPEAVLVNDLQQGGAGPERRGVGAELRGAAGPGGSGVGLAGLR